MKEGLSFTDKVAERYKSLNITRRELLIAASSLLLGGAAVALVENKFDEKDTIPDEEKEQQPRFATGIDISYPQGLGERYHGEQYDFVVVGVNDGLPTEPNSYLVEQLKIAAELTRDANPSQTGMLPIQLYLNTANPADFFGTPDVKSSPEADMVETPYGMCNGADNQACMYRYGWQRAEESMAMFGAAAKEAGVSIDPAGYTVWLDVETQNSWRQKPKEGENPQKSNRAVLEGMVAYLQSVGAGVGLYSVESHWNEIIGDTVAKESNLYDLPTWYPVGSVSENEAKEMLAKGDIKPLTGGGKVTMIQRVEGKNANDPDAQDYNYALAA